MNHYKRTLVFPNATGSNLEGKARKLPNDFEGDLNIVITAFRREHIDLIESWINSIAQMTRKNTRLRFYELPVLSMVYSPFRWWIDGGMRAGILDEEARERTITVYTDKRKFKKQLEIPNEETTYIFLVSRNGAILWRDQLTILCFCKSTLQDAVQEDLPI